MGGADEAQLVAHVGQRRREERPGRRAEDRAAAEPCAQRRRQAMLAGQRREAGQRVAGEQAQRDRRDGQVARQDREARGARCRRTWPRPPRTARAARAARSSRAAATASTAPTGASSATGGRTVAPMNDTNEPGHVLEPRSRPRSSASSVVACSECSGSPVTDAGRRAPRSAARPTHRERDRPRRGGAADVPQPREPGEHPRLRPQQAREREQRQRARADRGPRPRARPPTPPAPGTASRRSRARRRAGTTRWRRRTRAQRAGPAAEHRRAEPVGAEDQRRVREQADEHERAVGALAEDQPEQRAERDPQRVLGRRGVGLEGRRRPSSSSRPQTRW